MAETRGWLYVAKVSQMKPNIRMVVFTDLDGSLLDHRTYSYEPALEALGLLERQRIPVVLCSSKTRAEMELLRLALRLPYPFISENGGGLFLPPRYFPSTLAKARRVGDLDVIEFGVPYWQLVEALHQAASRVGIEVRGFSDMSIEEVAEDSQLSLLEARLAKLREYDEPFRILDTRPALRRRLFDALHRRGLRCTRGGRYYHVTAVTDKGLGVRTLRQLYEQHWGKVLTVGLGDSLNDAALLREVDMPVVVQNPAAGATTRLLRQVPTATLTHAPGPRGWNQAILEVVGKYVLRPQTARS
jgi:mannosyl-3-phosphoglycerate phosphatase